MYKLLGTDGMAWAKEMHERFPTVSVEDLYGWCCNMIEAGRIDSKKVLMGAELETEEISKKYYNHLKQVLDTYYDIYNITKIELCILRIIVNFKLKDYQKYSIVIEDKLYQSLQEKNYIKLHGSDPIEITELGRKVLEYHSDE